MKLSIVTTMYRSEPFLVEFYSRMRASAEKITAQYEIIFVDDGSPDASLQLARSFHESDPRVKVIELSRNFGHHKAMMTGLRHTKGELVFLIDCDLEENPELLQIFHEKLHELSADVVYGVQNWRNRGWKDRVSGLLFYWIFNALSTDPIPRNVSTVRLMTKGYVESLVQHQEREFIIAGLWAVVGFKQEPVVIHRTYKRTTSYSLRHKIALTVNAITSFSNKPLVLIFYLGMIISLFATLVAAYLIARRILYQEFLAGWPSLIVSVWLLGGLTIFCIGLIGVYLSKIFVETKARPYTIIRTLYDGSQEASHEIRQNKTDCC